MNPDAALEEFAQTHPIGRLIQPEDVANVVLFLASDKAGVVTGITMPVDGGLLSGIVSWDIDTRRRRTVSRPLDGVRVLDFTALVQGPMATQMLGDLGADVIKIEKVGGEWMRFWGILNGQSHGEMDSFLAFNRNKRSAEADLRDPQIRERILELAAEADVVVENFRPGVMARLGLGYEDMQAVNPRIIYASSSGYGQSGPYVKRPGQDLLIQALSGVMFLTGRAGEPPTAHGVGVTDQYTALHIVDRDPRRAPPP